MGYLSNLQSTLGKVISAGLSSLNLKVAGSGLRLRIPGSRRRAEDTGFRDFVLRI